VIEAAKTKPYGFFPFYPSPKVGGHCIPLDPFYLSYKAKEYNFWTRFIELAGEINELMPHFVMTKVIWVLNLKGKPVRGSKVLVWGVAYKKDIGDTREGAAYDVIADLIRKGAKVDYFDPYVPEFEVKHRIIKNPVLLKSIKFSLQKIKKYDLVLILTDHSGFDYEKIAQKAKLVVDTRNAIKSRKHKNVFWL
jgi:UDP-N-acetyl-D-glucosamine dehydrogenase